jgi:hypothetical protein
MTRTEFENTFQSTAIGYAYRYDGIKTKVLHILSTLLPPSQRTKDVFSTPTFWEPMTSHFIQGPTDDGRFITVSMKNGGIFDPSRSMLVHIRGTFLLLG